MSKSAVSPSHRPGASNPSRGLAPSGRLGADIGGTFTDIVLVRSDGALFECKAPSTPGDYGQGVLDGIDRLLADAGLPPEAITEVVHGSTVGTNAILTRSGPPVGLLTTKGFRDVLEIGRIRTPTLYDLQWEKPVALVQRRHRLEVKERVSATGEILEPIDWDSVRVAAEHLADAGIRSLAVCLINSYVQPTHERQIAAYLAEHYPQLAVCLSSDVLPMIKEYERTSSTVINAYLQPVIQGYLTSLQSGLTKRGLKVPLRMLRSDGGVMSAEAAAERPIFVAVSGPAGGVIASQHVAQMAGLQDVVVFDMGGTTAKAAVIEGGKASRVPEYEVRGGISSPSRFVKAGGYLLMVPAIDLAEVGAGAGSIARVDAAGGVLVGPESAGAIPGPACYGLGGAEPTITDANVVLGYLNPESLLGGELKIDHDKALRAVTDRVADRLGLDPVDAAYGIHAIANSNMLRAIRAVTVERGRDARTFACIAFGGSGPVHAAHIALSLGMSTVVVPQLAGLFSALGLLWSELEYHYSRSHLIPAQGATIDELRRQYLDLGTQAAAAMKRDGYASNQVKLEYLVDMRYSGQSAVLTIPFQFGNGEANGQAIGALLNDFAEEHRRTYGHRLAEEPVEFVSFRVTARPASGPRTSDRIVVKPKKPAAAGVRRAFFGPESGFLDTPVIDRGGLTTEPQPGPVLIEEYGCTTVVPPGCRVRVDDHMNIVIEIRP
jgi:N-methylhydantoinase A